MNQQNRQHQNNKTTTKGQHIVSSRRGSNFLLHDLEENDVVFGTKGNGRNEIFLKVLESHSEQYVQLSKFQKMGLIQNIIRDWKGNFYILNSKTNDLSLAKKKDHDLSTTDPSSRKLYTSVRRMMNYVNSKVQRQSHSHQQQIQTTRGIPSAGIARATSMEPMVAADPIVASNVMLTTKKERQSKPRAKNSPALPRHPDIAIPAAPEKERSVMASTSEYLHKNRFTNPLPKNAFFALPCNSSGFANISKPSRSVMLVTPEPSPRPMFQDPATISPIPMSQPVMSQNKNAALVVPSSPLSPFYSPTISQKNNSTSNDMYSNKHTSIAITNIAFTANKKRHYINATAADNHIGHLEESAILALTSLGSISYRMSS